MDGLALRAGVGDLGLLTEQLPELVTQLTEDAARIDAITTLERLKSACCAAQAQLAADLYTCARMAAQRRAQAGGAPFEDIQVRRSVGAQVGLARRESPHAGRGHVNLGCALSMLPAIRGCLQRGDTDDYRATLVARELGCLSEADQAKADVLVAEKLPRHGCRAARSHAAGVAARLDQEAVLAKIRRAVQGRHVAIRNLPDAMVQLSAVLPMATGVAAYASLCRHADTLAAGGDPVQRSRGQIMADEYTARLLGLGDISATSDPQRAEPQPDTPFPHDAPGPTGAGDHDEPGISQDPAAPADHHDLHIPGGVDDYGLPTDPTTIDIHLVITDRALFDEDDEPALIPGHGPIPAALARQLAGADHATQVFLRRLYTDPTTHHLQTIDPRRRLFPDKVRRFLLARDQICRTPWCDAPIRHHDHITAYAAGGPTSPTKAQGLCEACNHSKQTPGWQQTVHPDGHIQTTTPTGHHHTSTPPEQPHSEPWCE